MRASSSSRPASWRASMLLPPPLRRRSSSSSSSAVRGQCSSSVSQGSSMQAGAVTGRSVLRPPAGRHPRCRLMPRNGRSRSYSHEVDS